MLFLQTCVLEGDANQRMQAVLDRWPVGWSEESSVQRSCAPSKSRGVVIKVHCRALPDTRTANSAAAWLAECEVDGRPFEARSRRGAPNALARELVAAGVPDVIAPETQRRAVCHRGPFVTAAIPQ